MIHSPPVYFTGQVPAATMLVFLACCALFGLSLLLARRARGPAAGKGKRDGWSMLGIIVQGLSISAVSGPVHMIGGRLIDGLVHPRTLLVLALMLAAIALFRWASATMGRNWAIVAQVRSDQRLVTDGPFALVRNPIYVALLFFAVALAIATGHEAALPFGLPLYLIGTAIRIVREEALLRATFGAEYDAYAARVKRLIPGII